MTRAPSTKKQLQTAIKQIPEIRKLFREVNDDPFDIMADPVQRITDNRDFIRWRENVSFCLNEIYERTHDQYVWHITAATGPVAALKTKRKDEPEQFENLAGALETIGKNIDKYFPGEKEERLQMNTSRKVFISHSTKDKDVVELLVGLLADIGLNKGTLFCSSSPDYAIPAGNNIYDYLREIFGCELYVIFVLSDNYYKSVACLNEMGAAWVLKKKHVSILVHGFSHKNIEGVVNPHELAISLDGDDKWLKQRLNELKNDIAAMFDLDVPDLRWEEKRNKFIKDVAELSTNG